MNRNQTIAVIVALVVSLSLSATAWWLVWTLASPSVPSALAGVVGTFTAWYGFAVAYNALRREVWL
jgi:hypothetical protein